MLIQHCIDKINVYSTAKLDHMQVCLHQNKWMEGVDAEEKILMKMNCSFSKKVDEALVVFVPRLDLR